MTLGEIAMATRSILHCNRQFVHDFLHLSVPFVENLLAGLEDFNMWEAAHLNRDTTFLKFKDYVLKNEERITSNLLNVKCYIDATNTYTLVAGEGRPEKVL